MCGRYICVAQCSIKLSIVLSADMSVCILPRDPECSVCMAVFNDPRVLPCGHSFCADCIAELCANKTAIQCPTCRKRYRCSSSNDIPKNFDLAQLLEVSFSQPKTPPPMTSASAQTENEVKDQLQQRDEQFQCGACGSYVTLSDLMFCTPHKTYLCLKCVSAAHKQCDFKHAEGQFAKDIRVELRNIDKLLHELSKSVDHADIVANFANMLQMTASNMKDGISVLETRALSAKDVLEGAFDVTNNCFTMEHLQGIVERRMQLIVEHDSVGKRASELANVLPPLQHLLDQNDNPPPKPGEISTAEESARSYDWVQPNLYVRCPITGRVATVVSVEGMLCTIQYQVGNGIANRQAKVTTASVRPIVPARDEEFKVIRGEDKGRTGKVLLYEGGADCCVRLEGNYMKVLKLSNLCTTD